MAASGPGYACHHNFGKGCTAMFPNRQAAQDHAHVPGGCIQLIQNRDRSEALVEARLQHVREYNSELVEVKLALALEKHRSRRNLMKVEIARLEQKKQVEDAKMAKDIPEAQKAARDAREALYQYNQRQIAAFWKAVGNRSANGGGPVIKLPPLSVAKGQPKPNFPRRGF